MGDLLRPSPSGSVRTCVNGPLDNFLSNIKILTQVVDDTLVEWILPGFTTTTTKDTTACSVVMMATLKQCACFQNTLAVFPG